MSVIDELNSAYDYFNAHLHDGCLPPRHGERRTEISFGHMQQSNHLATCAKMPFGWRICISSEISGMDIGFLLIRLAHETFHIACWRAVDHDEIFREFARRKGMEINERGELVRIIPGGMFERVRDTWLAQRRRASVDTPADAVFEDVETQQSDPLFVVGIVATLALVVILGFSAMGGESYGGGYERDYVYRGSMYNDY